MMQHPHYETFAQRDHRVAWERTDQFLRQCRDLRLLIPRIKILEPVASGVVSAQAQDVDLN